MSQENNNLKRLKAFKYKFGVGISLLVTTIVMLITSVVVWETNTLLTDKVMSLAYDLNNQTRANLDDFFDNVEKTSLYLYSHEEYVDYKPSDKKMNSYEKSELEKELNAYLYDLSIFGSYADFMVVYDNGSTLGRLTEDTSILFDGNLYTEAKAYLEESGKNRAWLSGYRDNFNRIYYIRELNDEAIFMSSTFYSVFGNILVSKDNENTMHIAVLNEKNQVVYDSTVSQIGKEIEIGNEAASIDETTLRTLCVCANGWKVTSTSNTSIILKERSQAISFVVIIALIVIMISIVTSIAFTYRLVVPQEKMMEKLYQQSIQDSQTYFFKRNVFMDEAKKLLEDTVNDTVDGKAAFIYIDINSMKHINYRRGHEYGDSVIIAVADSIRKVFGEAAVVGRVDGEEFALVLPVFENDKEQITNLIENKCKALNTTIHHYLANNDDKSVAVSVGISMAPDYGKDINLLYDLAERAMYAAKKDETKDYHFYDYTKDYNTWAGNGKR